MTSTRYTLLFLLVPFFVAGEAQAYEEAIARGAELLEPFKQELKSALQAGLEKGPVEAIGVCRVLAPEIAESLQRDGIRLGRTSHKLRNSANSSPEWVNPALQAYLDDDSNRASYVVRLSGDRWGYVEPIVTQPLCLTCHGQALSAEIARRIDDLYPDDQAVGFKAGDLRGVFWLEFPTGK